AGTGPSSARPRPTESVPAGATATATATDGAPAPAGDPTADEGETGPYVDELFARIRAEGSATGDARREAEADTADHDEGGAVAVANRSADELAASHGSTGQRVAAAPRAAASGVEEGEADERDDDASLD